jgi:nicotinate (nicotinamide) nucleotide adenylyltransferase
MGTQTSSPIQVENAENDLRLQDSIVKSMVNRVQDNSDKEHVVLIATGSYSPVHRMHVHIFNEAKQVLEEEHGKVVLGGLLSPSHNSHVFGKLYTEGIHSKHRVEMCKLAIEEAGYSDWLFVDEWECSANQFINFPKVTRTLYDYLKEIEQFKNVKLRCMYLCGTDLYYRCGQMISLRYDTLGVVVLKRSEDGYNSNDLQSDPSTHLYVIHKSSVLDNNDLSSTKVRQHLEQQLDCSHITFHSVVQYLQRNAGKMSVNPIVNLSHHSVNL